MCSSGPSWGQVTWFSLHSGNTEEGEGGGGGEGEEGKEGEGEGERGEELEGEEGSEAEREDIKAAFQSVLQAQATASTRGKFQTNHYLLSFSSSLPVTGQALKRKSTVSEPDVDTSLRLTPLSG